MMKYFKDGVGRVFAYESDGSQDAAISAALIAISESEAMKLSGNAQTLADQVEQKRAEIEAWRDAQENAALVFEHAGRQWDGGLRVRTRLQPVIALPALPPGFFWTDNDNNDVEVTLADVQALNVAHEAALVLRGWQIHTRQREMKEEVSSLTDPDEVAAYVVGWPE